MYYSDEIIEQVREANDIVDVIGTYVRLNRSGSGYVGLCPFHNEKTGSFHVNKTRQMYKCFGCGKGGGVFTFLMEYDNLSFPEAVKTLADRVGIALPEVEMTEEERARRNLKERILEINKLAAGYYYKMLRSEAGQSAYTYFRNRGLSDETMKNFGLGYAGQSTDNLYRFLKGKGFTDAELKASAMFRFSEQGVMDMFWSRAMFPIMDRNGKVIAFGGRIMSDAKNQPKYLNSNETKAFSKGDNLYGLHLAKHSRRGYFLLCEGYMDTIALHQAGFDNAVASLGTALTEKQARLISKFTKEVALTYDSDEAGCKAILRAIPILKNEGITTKVVIMNPGLPGITDCKDPDEFIQKNGAEAYEERIRQAVSAFDFEAKTLKKSIDERDPAQKTKFDHELARKLARISDEIERDNYIEAAARDYNIDVNSLKRLVNRLGREEYLAAVAEETQERDKKERRELTKPEEASAKSEQLLLSMLTNNSDLYEMVAKDIEEDDFTDDFCRRLAGMIFTLCKEGQTPVHARIITRFEEAEEQQKAALILSPSLYEDKISESERKRAFADLVVRILMNSYERRWQQALEQGDAVLLQKLIPRRSEIEEIGRRLRI